MTRHDLRQLRRLSALLLFGIASACGSSSPGSPDAAVTTADAAVSGACEATSPRTVPPEVFIGPTGLEARMGALIDGAQRSLDLQMYLFTVSGLATKVIAAHQRGVAVRVLLDPDEAGNTSTKRKFVAAGVPVKDTPAIYSFAHAKYLIVDGGAAAIMSANFNLGAMQTERNYGLLDRDPDDLADLQAIFDADWGGPVADLACTRLIVSPVNAASRVVALINAAKTSLDLEVFYLTETSTQTAVAAAKARGVAVRLILADPAGGITSNTATIAYFKGLGVPVKIATSFDLHAKLVIADGVAFVGSENMSYTSFTKNREVGALVFEPAQAAPIAAQFAADWAITVAP